MNQVGPPSACGPEGAGAELPEGLGEAVVRHSVDVIGDPAEEVGVDHHRDRQPHQAVFPEARPAFVVVRSGCEISREEEHQPHEKGLADEDEQRQQDAGQLILGHRVVVVGPVAKGAVGDGGVHQDHHDDDHHAHDVDIGQAASRLGLRRGRGRGPGLRDGCD